MKDFIILIGSFFIFTLGFSQVEVIQFNSSWNTANSFDMSKLKECDTSTVSICDNPKLKEKHNIKSVPTLIVFEAEEEIDRFEANIMMQLSCSRKEVQHIIDSIYLKRFE